MVPFLFAMCSMAYAASTENAQVSTAEGEGGGGVQRNMRNEEFGLAPQIGAIGYHDPSGSYTSRAAIGVGVDYNAAALLGLNNNLYLGAGSGFDIARAGYPTANMLGGGTMSNSNMVIVPVDLKVGYNLTDKFRTSVRGGGDVVYKSNAASVNFGGPNDWTMHPDVGVDLEWQVSKRVSVQAKPDLFFTPGENVFVGMLGANILL